MDKEYRYVFPTLHEAYDIQIPGIHASVDQDIRSFRKDVEELFNTFSSKQLKPFLKFYSYMSNSKHM